ncbi:hypothetical protein BS78_04G305800 [Paspalum vaginatum]|nr:hypothetical protein BS78_04G305800 [Paspalum vaginatum]
MQPSGREMQPGGGGHDDFFDQMLSTLPAAWSDLGSGKSPWELPAGAADAAAFDESAALLASRLRHHQIGGGGAGDKPVMLHLSDLHGLAAGGGGGEGGAAAAGSFFPLPLFADRATAEGVDAAFKAPSAAGGDQALYNGFGAAGMHGAAAGQTPFVGQGGSMPAQSFGGGAAAAAGGAGGSAPAGAPAAGASSGGGAAPPRQQRQRAKRGQATDPHSIAERVRHTLPPPFPSSFPSVNLIVPASCMPPRSCVMYCLLCSRAWPWSSTPLDASLTCGHRPQLRRGMILSKLQILVFNRYSETN